MNDKALLNEFSNVTVATIYSDRVELDGILIERLLGSGFYAMVEYGCYYISDMENDDELTYLADSLAGALDSLNDYEYYFNDEFWLTDFEYSIRSADDFKKVVNEMQKELREGIE